MFCLLAGEWRGERRLSVDLDKRGAGGCEVKGGSNAQRQRRGGGDGLAVLP